MTSHPTRFFHGFNYSLANEDSSVELEVLHPDARHVLCVAGSGARMLTLLAKHPRRVTCVDVSPEQLRLAELRVESARALPLDRYLAFWGYPPREASAEERRDLFAGLRLASSTREFWERVFREDGWRSVLYDGLWERTFAKLARVNGMLTRGAGRALFDARTLDEQRAFLRERFPRRRWLLTLLLLGNPVVFNLMLYKGDFPRKNLPGSPYAFYREVFDRLYDVGPARENYFLQLVFFGRLRFPEGNPIECSPDIYEGIRASLAHTDIVYRQGDAFDVARREGPFDFISLSDVPSYLRPPREQSFLQDLSPHLEPGGDLVVRFYLRIPEATDRAGYEDLTSRFDGIIAREKVGVYRIEVLRKR